MPPQCHHLLLRLLGHKVINLSPPSVNRVNANVTGRSSLSQTSEVNAAFCIDLHPTTTYRISCLERLQPCCHCRSLPLGIRFLEKPSLSTGLVAKPEAATTSQ